MRRCLGIVVLLCMFGACNPGAALGAGNSRPARFLAEGWSIEHPAGIASDRALRKQALPAPDGSILLIWVAEQHGKGVVMAARFGQGRLLGEPMRISTDPGDARKPRAVATEDGTVYVVWESRGDDRIREIRLAAVRLDGSPLLTDRAIVAGHGQLDDPEVVIDGLGRVLVFWGDWLTDRYRLAFTVLDQSGKRIHPRAYLDVPGANPATPIALFDRNNRRIVLIWVASNHSGARLWHGRLDDDVRFVGTPREVGAWFSGEKGTPGAVVDARGRLHVAWTVFESGGGLAHDQRFLMHAVLLPDGSFEIPPHRLPTGGNGNPCWPSVALDGRGKAFVAWSDNNDSAFQAYFAALDGSGNAASPPARLDVSASASLAPQVAVDGSGHQYVFWTRLGEATGGAHIGFVETLHPARSSLWRRAGLDEKHPVGSALYNAIGTMFVYVMPFLTLNVFIVALLFVLLRLLGAAVKIEADRHWPAFSLAVFSAILLLEETPLYFDGGRFFGVGFEILGAVLSAGATLLILRPRRWVSLDTIGGKLLLVLMFLAWQLFFVNLAATVAGLGW